MYGSERRMRKTAVTIWVLILLICSALADPNYYMQKFDKVEPGYLFIGGQTTKIGIFDNYARQIDSSTFEKSTAGLDLTYQKNGAITYWNVDKQKYYQVDINFKHIDSFEVTSPYVNDFHDLDINADGSYVLIFEDYRNVDMSQIVPNGKQNAVVIHNGFQYFNKNKQLQFTWNSKDHIQITETCVEDELTSTLVRYFHLNSVDTDTDGNFLISARNVNQVMKINRSTGAVMWRMGGSKSKNNQYTFINDTDADGFVGFSHIHDVRRLENGHIILFDNANLKPTTKSRIVEYEINETAKTAKRIWDCFPEIQPNFTYAMGSAQRLPNGNTLGTFIDKIIEFDKDAKEVMYSFVESDIVYRVNKFIYKMNADSKVINSTGNYTFTGSNGNTGLQLNITSIQGSSRFMVSQHNYAPYYIQIKGNKPEIVVNKRWTIVSDNTFSGKIVIDTRQIENFNPSDSFAIYHRYEESKGDFTKLNTFYNSSNKTLEADIQSGGEFFIGSTNALTTKKVELLSPRDKSSDKAKAILKWYSLGVAKSYEINIATDSLFNNMVLSSSSVTSNTFTTNLLLDATNYYWRVRAKDGANNSQWSDTWGFRTFLKKVEPFRPLQNTRNVLLNNIAISWKATNNASKYELQLGEDTLFENTNLHYQVVDTFKMVGGFEYRKYYYWRVRAFDNNIANEWSDIFRFKTEIEQATVSFPLDNQQGISLKPKIEFKVAKEAEIYQYQLSTDSLLNNSTIVSSQIINQLTPILKEFETYYVRIRGIAFDDTSRWSNIIKFKTQINKPLLKSPINFQLDVDNPTELKISKIDSASGYEVNLTKYTLDNILVHDTIIQSNVNTISLEGLEYLFVYKWKARAIHKFSKSDWSNQNEFLVKSNIPLSKPTLVFPFNNSMEVSENGLLSWQEYPNESYRIILASDSMFTKIIIDKFSITPNILYSALTNNTRYYWKVARFSEVNHSEWSDRWSFTTKASSVFGVPKLLLPEDKTKIKETSTKLLWEKVVDATKYNLEISEKEDLSNPQVTNDIQNIEYTVKGLKPLTYYYWRTNAVKNTGEISDWSKPYSFFVDELSSIEQIPAYTNDLLPEDYAIYNLVGLEITTNQIERKLNNLKQYLPEGVYFILDKSSFKLYKIILVD